MGVAIAWLYGTSISRGTRPRRPLYSLSTDLKVTKLETKSSVSNGPLPGVRHAASVIFSIHGPARSWPMTTILETGAVSNRRHLAKVDTYERRALRTSPPWMRGLSVDRAGLYGRLVGYAPSTDRSDRIIDMPGEEDHPAVMFGGPELDILFLDCRWRGNRWPRFPGDGVTARQPVAIYDLGIRGLPDHASAAEFAALHQLQPPSLGRSCRDNVVNAPQSRAGLSRPKSPTWSSAHRSLPERRMPEGIDWLRLSAWLLRNELSTSDGHISQMFGSQWGDLF